MEFHNCLGDLNIERGDSVIETDNYKFELAQYESPLQEVRDSL